MSTLAVVLAVTAGSLAFRLVPLLGWVAVPHQAARVARGAGVAAMTAMVVRGVLEHRDHGVPGAGAVAAAAVAVGLVARDPGTVPRRRPALRASGIRPAGLSRAVAHLSHAGLAEGHGHRQGGLSRGWPVRWWQRRRSQRAASSGCPALVNSRQASSSRRRKAAWSPSARARWARASRTAASHAVPVPPRRRRRSDGEVTPGGVEVTDVGAERWPPAPPA